MVAAGGEQPNPDPRARQSFPLQKIYEYEHETTTTCTYQRRLAWGSMFNPPANNSDCLIREVLRVTTSKSPTFLHNRTVIDAVSRSETSMNGPVIRCTYLNRGIKL